MNVKKNQSQSRIVCNIETDLLRQLERRGIIEEVVFPEDKRVDENERTGQKMVVSFGLVVLGCYDSKTASW